MEGNVEFEFSDKKAVDALYRISKLSAKEKNPVEALEGISMRSLVCLVQVQLQ